MGNGQKRTPIENKESDEDSLPTRRKSKTTRRKKIEDSDDEFEISAGDVISDLDYEEAIPQ